MTQDDQAAISNATRMMQRLDGDQHTNVNAADLMRICALALKADPESGLAQSFAKGAGEVRGFQTLVVKAGQLREVLALAQQRSREQEGEQPQGEEAEPKQREGKP